SDDVLEFGHEVAMGMPPQLAQACVIEAVADILTGTVLDRDPGSVFRDLQQPSNRPQDIDVLQFGVAAGVVDTVALALVDDSKNAVDRVLHMQPRADVAAVAMHDGRSTALQP